MAFQLFEFQEFVFTNENYVNLRKMDQYVQFLFCW